MIGPALANWGPMAFLGRFVHPGKLLPPLPGNPAALAGQLLGMSDADYQALVRDINQYRRQIALEILADERLSSVLSDLPFSDGDVIVAIGDSLTDDALGWFEILAEVARMSRRDKRLDFINLAVSGESSAQTLAQLGSLAGARPAWVFCLAGGNDLRRFGSMATKTQASTAETLRNLAILREHVMERIGANWCCITPIGVDELRAASSPLWQGSSTYWRDADFEELVRSIKLQDREAIDARAGFVHSLSSDLFEDDGLHPAPSGQVALASLVIQALRGRTERSGK